ncbi:MAG: TetR/AcrR family transcriptional regulator [Candidatus Cloacimonetes bacterium]|nr:TetR/AcrR family transcriptional regulator [Candidatus Cloacimonadota bacterium]MCB5287921.1 TetR/AcrR family transcriptional regulator [Candidatus Cloacimonadota bacterium]MCK9185222.1 TetR/AcrR family transcriptional regulator [Candidatus Cloacimonadota bacterium]MCK9584890.1 TetR/AcrR family transcriptional regulator [Candidatus Cloacimonadota bacterium]MDY0230241.1 TetR/AcrR family transcriptional regulator [Candidatus Cloacimonadaceae bacterium]
MRNTIKHLIDKEIRSKQRKLIETAAQLFFKHGFKKVTIEEICRTAKVSKVTFYRYFSSKDEMIKYITRLLGDNFAIKLEQIIDRDSTIKSKFDDIAILKQDFAANLGGELRDSIFNSPAVKEYMHGLDQRLMQKFEQLMHNEQAQGNINPQVDIEKAVAFISRLNQLLSDDSFTGIYPDLKEMIGQVNELLVMGLKSRELS